jgi:hypothetical protein
MRGDDNQQEGIFSYISPEKRGDREDATGATSGRTYQQSRL